MKRRCIIGIDVSKYSLDCFYYPEETIHQEVNTNRGIDTLIRNLKNISPDIIIVEATGQYHRLLVEKLHHSLLPVKVVNQRQVRNFARSLNKLCKTDAIDAKILDEFSLSRCIISDTPKSEHGTKLSALLVRREQLQFLITQEKCHIESTEGQYAHYIEAILDTLKAQLKEIDASISQVVKKDEKFAQDNKIIQSIPGIGPIVSATILTECPEITRIGRKQLAFLVGVAPFNRDSGRFRGQRHITAGRAKIRKVLYCAMRPCLRWNSTVRNWFEHFLSSGKPYKVAVVACMRKLLMVLRAMLISQRRWHPSLKEDAETI